ncbi:hypothetical protein OHB26_20005 [Nocardia sp. NBC_01503]|uniref:hypothetical protein n=1 Tax=Nocardia sp. NBC_01503 TaxID=2975997 RepID=UPI002E7BE9E1|nr:hypothetical protein [Nocardia sp. NBC_01503]WTL29300.1 hypothetical protein OHB26_20005 [Nocardia sp. NBC_01503]
MTTSRARAATLTTTAAAGIGAILLATAPNAAALGDGYVSLQGSNPQVGCGYTLTSGDMVGGGSSSSNGLEVTFFDDGATIGTGTVGGLIGKAAQTSWTPKTAGQHTLTATWTFGQGDIHPLTPLTVQVRASTSTGSFGCPLPSISG